MTWENACAIAQDKNAWTNLCEHYEFAKSRAQRACVPYVPACLRVRVPSVLACPLVLCRPDTRILICDLELFCYWQYFFRSKFFLGPIFLVPIFIFPIFFWCKYFRSHFFLGPKFLFPTFFVRNFFFTLKFFCFKFYSIQAKLTTCYSLWAHVVS